MVNNIEMMDKAAELVRAIDDDALLESLWQAQLCRERGDCAGEAFWREVGFEIQKIEQSNYYVNW